MFWPVWFPILLTACWLTAGLVKNGPQVGLVPLVWILVLLLFLLWRLIGSPNGGPEDEE